MIGTRAPNNIAGDVLLFPADISFGCWRAGGSVLNRPSTPGLFMLSTASVSAFAYEHDLSRPVIRLWNDTHHVTTASELEDDLGEIRPSLRGTLDEKL
ncbi:MAG TPA: hypothetical protein VH351_07950 [Bryobacteraceae bacterium]|nr:hypothetical protein [Bryobacteraceae bacterium]